MKKQDTFLKNENMKKERNMDERIKIRMKEQYTSEIMKIRTITT
jgi:hypothetical protein